MSISLSYMKALCKLQVYYLYIVIERIPEVLIYWEYLIKF